VKVPRDLAVKLDQHENRCNDNRVEQPPSDLVEKDCFTGQQDEHQHHRRSDDEVGNTQHKAGPLLGRGVGSPPHDVHGNAEEVGNGQSQPETGVELAEVEADDRSQPDQDECGEHEPERKRRIEQLEGVSLLGDGGG